LVTAAGSVPGAAVLDVHSDPDHNRSVFTLLGEAPGLVEAMLRLFKVALQSVDLSRHQGAHPRVGVVDVVPFVPLSEQGGMQEAIAAAMELARRVGESLEVPVFLYGDARRRDELVVPAGLRSLGSRALARAMEEGRWKPDFGPAHLDPRRGVSLVGARRPLIAFNVWLDTDRVEIARRIAARLRESGGGLAAVQAIGVLLKTRGKAQVSLNLLDWRVTSMYEAMAAVRREAAACGVAVAGSEIVGLVPKAAVERERIESLSLLEELSVL
ncbi:MAG: glutamate formimidoyltransferase, partial [Acidobacteria bacterium]|nr:glutamate formimidoyltransferase [Acidobacteriota bacterium]